MDKSKSITRTMAAEFIFYAIMFDDWRNLRRLKCADTARPIAKSLPLSLG